MPLIFEIAKLLNMLNTENTIIQQLIIHKIDNHINDYNLFLSSALVDLREEIIRHLLKKYFFHSFKDETFYQFEHDHDLNQNKAYKIIGEIFDNPSSFIELSKNLVQLLHQYSQQPQIKAGEVYIAYFNDCVVDDEMCDAVGIFKSETKESYLKVKQQPQSFNLNNDEGVNINKLDKGVIVLNTEREHGFKMKVVDRTNNIEAKYWLNTFLKAKIISDDYYHTQQYMHMCKDFALEALPDDKLERAGFINDSSQYFQENQQFDKASFQEKVLQKPEIIEAFENYQEDYAANNAQPSLENFDIEPKAVKKLKPVFKSVIKLDKNFHIYVHGNKDMIKKGFDDASGMHFYQLFYSDED